jgi:hypothetical protein
MLMNSFYIFHRFNNNAFFSVRSESCLQKLFDDSYVSVQIWPCIVGLSTIAKMTIIILML